ncbi:MAG: hypothetical protein MOGMAGMI_00308 [Candidatus Omnitrophica bacterium]|nr:hypothetical protein [Candidatus Omnitrophota bacterium]
MVKSDILERYRSEISTLSSGDLGKETTLIEFKGLSGGVLGECNGLAQTIYINSKYWDSLDEREKLILIAHEFYHCNCFKFKHEDVVSSSEGCPESYMSANAGTRYCTFLYFQQYTNQIAQGCNYKY